MDFDLARLLEKTLTIDELLAQSLNEEMDEGIILKSEGLNQWCKSASNGDWSLFEKRLARDNESIQSALRKLNTKLSDDDPEWHERAKKIYDLITNQNYVNSEITNIENRFPFQHLYEPIIGSLASELRLKIDTKNIALLSEEAWNSLTDQLLEKLSALHAAILYKLFIEKTKLFSENPDSNLTKPHSRSDIYKSFIQEVKSFQYKKIIEEYPVLLRCATEICDQWLFAATSLIQRLNSDYTVIKTELDPTLPTAKFAEGVVVEVTGGLSDPHNDGQTVQIIKFKTGLKVVYKPKTLKIDVAWNSLINDLNESNAPIDLSIAKVVDKEKYGWSEFVSHASVIDSSEFAGFYKRSGALLCTIISLWSY